MTLDEMFAELEAGIDIETYEDGWNDYRKGLKRWIKASWIFDPDLQYMDGDDVIYAEGYRDALNDILLWIKENK
jgi:hypothetical protein